MFVEQGLNKKLDLTYLMEQQKKHGLATYINGELHGAGILLVCLK